MPLAEQIILPHLWRRYMSFLRALVGASCLWVVLASEGLSRATFVVMLAALTVYSAISLFWRLPERIDRYGLLNLTTDILFFFLCVALSPAEAFWLPAIAAFYLLVSMATQHSWREALLVTVVTLGFVNYTVPPFAARLQPVILLLGMLAVITALQKKSLLERLSNSSRQAVVYRSAVEQAREAERQRIAADLHDGPLQSFTSFSMRLEIVRRMFERNPETGFAELRSLQELCTRQATEMRTFVRSMRPAGSDGSGLAAALRQVVTMFQRDSGIPAEFHSDPEVSHDDLEASPELLQILREALHNVQKHSSASRASVQLRRSGESLELLVRDDGRGFPFEGAFSLDELDMMQMGPVSIKQRVRSLGGDLMVTSVRGDGATLTVRVPL